MEAGTSQFVGCWNTYTVWLFICSAFWC